MKPLAQLAITMLLVFSPILCQASGKSWMRALDGKLRLSEFSIPGTHNAGARFEPLAGTARCQSLTIKEQLDAGVRFLDVRCRHMDDKFAIYHGLVNQQLAFAQVLAETRDFLKLNPSECVMMSIQEEGSASGVSRSFEATLGSYIKENSGLWALDDGIPSLDHVRGKIVLVRRFRATASPLGIDASNWPDNSAFTSGSIKVQDIYRVSDNEEKWKSFTTLLDDAGKRDPDILCINFASGLTQTFGIPNIKSVSNDMNERISKYFTVKTHGMTGIIVMDFADAAKCALIYGTNFKSKP